MDANLTKKDFQKKLIEYIPTVKVDYKYLSEAMYCQNLYNGVSTLTTAHIHTNLANYLKIALETVSNNTQLFKTYLYDSSALLAFFLKHSEKFKQTTLATKLSEIKFELPNDDMKFQQKDYSEKEIYMALHFISNELGNKFSNSLKEELELKFIINKFQEPLNDCDYLADTDEILEYTKTTYSKLDYNHLETLTSTVINPNEHGTFETTGSSTRNITDIANSMHYLTLVQNLSRECFIDFLNIYNIYLNFKELLNEGETCND